MKALTIIGMPNNGCLGLSSVAASAVARADILVGGDRYLEFFPQFRGKKISFKKSILKVVEDIKELSYENNICVLASGDPLFFGIGKLLVKKIGIEHIELIPSPSSIQLAFSKIGVSWNDSTFHSCHGRDLFGIVTKLQQNKKNAILTDEKNGPAIIAKKLIEFNDTNWNAFVCEDLLGTNENIKTYSIKELSKVEKFHELNVLILIRNNDKKVNKAIIPNISEDEYSKKMPVKGLITKKEIRIISLAYMEIQSDSIIWDIGAGSGSVSIEAAKLAHNGKVFSIESDVDGIEIYKDNCRLHSVDNTIIINGLAPDGLDTFEDPNSIFIGGTRGNMKPILDICLDRLKVGGSLVLNAVTIDNVSNAYNYFKSVGIIPEVTLMNVSRSSKVASYLRYDSLNPIHIFKVKKENNNNK